MFHRAKNTRINDKVWEMRLNHFKEWLDKYPGQMPRIRAFSGTPECKIANWWNNQQTAYRKNILSPWRIDKLLTITMFKEIYERKQSTPTTSN
jgi:hypothetical protein